MPGNNKPLKLAALQFGGAQGPGINIIRDLRQAEAKSYQAATDFLGEHSKAGTLIEIVRRNFRGFSDSKTELAGRVPSPGRRGELQREASIELNRWLLNFMSATRQFLDHTETRLKRQYLGHPEVAAAFKTLKAAAYDGHFAYRFMYRLRNFGQHCGAPIGLVDFESMSVGQTSMTVHTLHVKFDPKTLLRDGSDVWGKVEKDLAAFPAPFDVEPLLVVVLQEIEAIWSGVQSTEKPFLQPFAAELVQIVSDVPVSAIPAVLRVLNRRQLQFVLPPFEVMEWLGITRFRAFT